MSDIKIDADAKDYIVRKTTDITVKMAKVGGGWCGPVFKPAVIAGKPDDLEDFEKQEVDGIAVYLSKEIEAKADQIRIKLRGFGMFKRLALEVL